MLKIIKKKNGEKSFFKKKMEVKKKKQKGAAIDFNTPKTNAITGINIIKFMNNFFTS